MNKVPFRIKKTWLFWGIGLLLLIFFWKDVGIFTAQKIASNLLSTNLKFEEVYFKDGKISFKNIAFASSKKGIQGQIEELRVAFHFFNQNTFLESELLLIKPHVELQKLDGKKNLVATSFASKKVECLDGIILFEGKELKIKKLTFQKTKQKNKGTVFLEKAKINYEFDKKNNQSHLEIVNLDLHQMFAFLKPLELSFWQDIQNLKGDFCGSLIFDHNTKVLAFFNGDFTNFVCRASWGKFLCKSLHFERSQLPLSTSFLSLIDADKSRFYIEGGQFVLTDKTKIASVKGFCLFHPEQGLQCKIQGNLCVTGVKKDFTITGEGVLKNRNLLTLNLKKEGYVTLELSKNGTQGTYDLKIENFALNLLQGFFPFQGTIKEGKFSAKLFGKIANRELQNCNITSLCVENLKGFLCDYELFIKELKSNSSFNLRKLKNTFSAQMQVIGHLQKGEQVGKIEGECLVENGRFSKALQLNISSVDAHGSLTIDGKLSELQGQVAFTSRVETLLTFLNKQAQDIFQSNEFLTIKSSWQEKDQKSLFSSKAILSHGGSIVVKATGQNFWNSLKNGWQSSLLTFKAKGQDIDLAKWQKIFWDEPQLVFSGSGDFLVLGKKDRFKLLARGEKLLFKTPVLVVEAQKIGNFNLPLTKGGGDNFCGFFNLHGEENFFASFAEGKVTFPLQQLELNVCNTKIVADEKRVKISLPSTSKDDLQCVGEVVVDRTKKIPIVEINASSIFAKVATLAPLLQEFATLQNVEGKFRGELYLSLPLFREQKPVEVKLKGHLDSITTPFLKQLKIKTFQGDIEFDSAENKVVFEEIRGELESKGNNYSIYLPFLKKLDTSWAFDVRCEKNLCELWRICGGLSWKEDLYFTFLENSHFFNEPLGLKECCLDNAFHLKTFKGSLALNLAYFAELSTFISDLDILPFPISPYILKSNSNGKIMGIFNFKDDTGSFSIKGKNLQIGSRTLKNVLLRGDTQRGKLKIKKCFFDDLIVDFSMEKEGNEWHLPYFIAYQKEHLLISAKNLSISNEGIFKGKIEETLIDYGKFPRLYNIFKQKIEGYLYLKGDLSGQLPSKAKPFALKVKGQMDFEKLKVQDYILQKIDKKRWSFVFSLDKGLKIYGGEIDCTLPYDNFSIKTSFKTLFYDRPKALWGIKEIQVPLLDSFGKQFCLSYFKSQKIDLHGDMFLDLNKDKVTFTCPTISFDIDGAIKKLENLSISKSGDLWELSAKYCHHDHSLIASATLTKKEVFTGEVSLYEEGVKSPLPMTMRFNYSMSEGLSIQDIRGSFCGYEAYFYRTSLDDIYDSVLLGELKCDLTRGYLVFSEKIRDICKRLKIGQGYELRGVLTIPKKEIEKTAFKGMLTGKNFEFGGFHLKTLFAQVFCNKETLQIDDFKISDSAGILTIPKLKVEHKDDWVVSLPFLQLKEFRPSFLKHHEDEETQIKPLVIKEFKFFDFVGKLNQANDLKGWGYFTFVNSFKKGKTIFDLPADVLGSLVGLDLELLIPVQGRAEYELQNGIFYLRKIENVFSENQRSKFLLLSKERVPCLDLDGNLTLDIGMKQYVLFKFTDKFVISIRGNLEKPIFDLKKKRRILPGF